MSSRDESHAEINFKCVPHKLARVLAAAIEIQAVDGMSLDARIAHISMTDAAIVWLSTFFSPYLNFNINIQTTQRTNNQ